MPAAVAKTRSKPVSIPARQVSAKDILDELKPLGSDGYKHVLRNHGIQEPFYGVKIEDMKKIQKRIKMNYQLALDLFDTGIYDAMYLAGLIADDAKMTQKDLQRWVEKANCPALRQYTVAWVASGSNHGREIALEWIDSKNPDIAIAGWATLGSLVSIKDDAELDLAEIKKLLQRVQKKIHDAPDRVRLVMNGFIIAVGSYIKSLTAEAVIVAKQVGKVSVNMGGTACKVPDAVEYINKVKQRGTIGKKRASAKF
jgi:3-methyladenine DNA glycosylase AlkD